MKIIIDKERSISYTVEIGNNHLYPWEIRQAIRQALSLEGYMEDTINEVFNIMPDTECQSEDPYIGEHIVYTKRDTY